MVFSNCNRRLYDNIFNYNFILIYANKLLLLFSDPLHTKANKMLQQSSKKHKSYLTQIAKSTSISTSTFEMIRKYSTSNKYNFVEDWYVHIEAPTNMFLDIYLFESLDKED